MVAFHQQVLITVIPNSRFVHDMLTCWFCTAKNQGTICEECFWSTAHSCRFAFHNLEDGPWGPQRSMTKVEPSHIAAHSNVCLCPSTVEYGVPSATNSSWDCNLVSVYPKHERIKQIKTKQRGLAKLSGPDVSQHGVVAETELVLQQNWVEAVFSRQTHTQTNTQTHTHTPYTYDIWPEERKTSSTVADNIWWP